MDFNRRFAWHSSCFMKDSDSQSVYLILYSAVKFYPKLTFQHLEQQIFQVWKKYGKNHVAHILSNQAPKIIMSLIFCPILGHILLPAFRRLEIWGSIPKWKGYRRNRCIASFVPPVCRWRLGQRKTSRPFLFGMAFLEGWCKTSREEVFGLLDGLYFAWLQGIFGHFGGPLLDGIQEALQFTAAGRWKWTLPKRIITLYNVQLTYISKVVSTHLWNTPLNLYQQAIKGFLS